MKKPLFIIIGIFVLIILFLSIALVNVRGANQALKRINVEYEYYLNREIYGTELATLINKSMDNNKERQVAKDKNGLYVGNAKDSIIIKVQMLNSKDTYPMEHIFALGTEQFVELFNTCKFKSKQVTYHEQTRENCGDCF